MGDWIDLVEAAGAHLVDKLAPSQRALVSSMSDLGAALAGVQVSQTEAANLFQSQLRQDVIVQRGQQLESVALDAADTALAAYRAALADTKNTLEKYALPAGVTPGSGGDAVQALVIGQVLETLAAAGDAPSAVLNAVEGIARDALAADSKATIAALTSDPARLYFNRCGVRMDWVYSGIARATSAASDGGDKYEQSRLDLLGLVSTRLMGLGDGIAIQLYRARQAFQQRYAQLTRQYPIQPDGVQSGGLGGSVPPLTRRDPYWGR